MRNILYEIGRGILSPASVSRLGEGTGNGPSDSPRLSADGRFVVFRSLASDLVEGDDNGLPDAFLFDLVTRRVALLSGNGEEAGSGNGRSFAPSLSGDARTVLFGSFAADLVPGDFNQSADLFAHVLPEPVPLALIGSEGAGEGRLRLVLTGPAGVQVVLEASPDFRSWVPISTNHLPATLEVEGAEPHRAAFYRTVVLP